MTHKSERRRFNRYSAEGLKVIITSMTGPWQEEASPETMLKNPSVIPMDFNQYGIAVLTTHHFLVGERIALQVREETGSLLDVDGVIMSRRRQGNWYRCGLTFDFKYNNDGLMSSTLVELEHQAIN